MKASRGLFIFIVFLAIADLLQAQDSVKYAQFSEHRCLPFYNMKKLCNTSIFQGNKKKKEYFEGWYFKMVSADKESILSVIPGISLSSDGEEQHAFIQIINGVNARTYYYSFPIDQFSFSTKEFAVRIGKNYFSRNQLVLNIGEGDSIVKANVQMYDMVDYKPGNLLNPGIMGWYRFVPFMECYHGVLSLTHRLKGSVVLNNEYYNFDNGKGYIEKDWGSSMPSSWIWMQSNHFTDSSTSFMLSIADIPWLSKSFTGFLGFLYFDNQIYPFATYRNSKLSLEVDKPNLLNISIQNKKHSFLITAKSNNTGMLKAPAAGAMDRRIPESIDAEIKIRMIDSKGKLIYSDSTDVAGLEMVEDFKQLQYKLK